MVECDSDPDIIVTIGLCAMERKVTSKPMKEILRRMDKFQHIRVIIFDEGMILNDPVDTWPICDALVSFYSEGFPLEKAIEYSELRNPYLVNDLESQYILMNRKLVYECLKREGVPVPRSVSVIRDGISPTPNVIESDDSIEIDGKVFHKPFVEKPINAEDHNVYIYFPSSAGGGSQRLFRKVGNLSSRYYPDSNIRTTGSFIYEDFLPTDGTDVKVYTVADDYAHAEARKSPALDGVVERDYEGKEVRYPVILTPREKNIAKKVANAVKQQICGFDLLRANGMSYVCDVNGFSFVKSSRKYYDDCSHILGVLITRKTAPRLCLPAYLPPGTDVDTPLVPTTCGTIMELRCVIAVIRHGDRTPKQKMKMEVRHERFFALFSKYASGLWIHELKLKRPTQLQEVLEIVRCILHEMETGECDDPQLLENKNKFEQLRYVLEMYGSFSGINRKIQLKYYAHGLPKNTKVKAADTLSSSASGGLNANETQPSLLLVVKWGGELTPAGRQQAENLGRAFRCIYPGGDGHYGKDPGLGLLRLHSTYRHDLKIYASDEGRVQMTAAAFAKGFLALEGELPPILVQMVKSANTNGLLDNDHDCRHYQNTVKHKLREVMSKREDFNEEDLAVLVPTGSVSMVEAMRYVNNPREACNRLFEHVRRLHEHLKLMATSLERLQAVQLYQGESWDLLLRRWGKLLKDFKPREGDYDLTKISDIYDNIKFDLQHNPGILVASEQHDFFMCAKSLADIVVPQEYGITKEEKLAIGQRICTPLMRKILSDARYTGVDECTRLHAGYSKGVASPERFVRSRLYFTSESHLHSLLTCLRYGGLADVTTDEQWRRAMDYVSTISEINYLAQIVIMIYEDPSVRLNSQVSVLSSGTSVGKCSTESLTQYSTRVGTHGSVTPLTYAPPRQKGRSVNVCEICSQQAKEQMPLPDDQLVSKSPDPSSNISLLTDPGVISSTSHSSLNNLDLNSSVSVALPPDCNNVADKLNNLRIWQAAVAAGAEPGGRMVSAIDKSGETSASTTSPNNELAAATDNNLSKKLDLKASLVTNGHAPCIEQEPNQQKTPPPLSTPEVTLQGSSGTRIGTPGRPKSMPFDTIYTKIPSDTSITSSFSLAPAPPDTPEVRATQSMPTPSSSCSNTAAAEEKKVSIGRFLITRSVTDQQESSKQQNPTATTAAKTQHTTSGTPAAATKAAEVNLPNCGTMPTSLSSTSSLTSKSQTLAPTRIMLCHVGRQATSCPPDRGHTGGVLVSADRQLTRSNTLDSSDRREYQARQQQQQQQEQQRSVTSGGGRQRQAPTASTSPSPARQSQSVGGKPPKIAVKRVACGTLLPKAVNTGQPPQRQQADNRRPEETLAEGVQSAGKATDGLVEQQPQMKLSLVQSQGSTEKTSFQGNDAVTSKLEDQEVLTPTANLQLQDQLQLAYHRMHQHNLMRRHSTGSLMLPHHQLANPNTGTLHSAGVSVSALPACSLGHFLGFLVDPCPLSATQTTTTAQPDELCPGPPQRVPQLPRKRVGRVKVEPLTTGHSLPARGELAEESVVDPRRPELTMGQRSGTLEVADEEEDDEQSTANNQTLNALTFPSSFSPYHIEFNRLVRSVAMGIPFPKPFCRSLISTAVIRGSRDDTQASSSVPDIKHLMEDPDQPPRTLTPGTSTDFPVPSAPSVPEVYPLETLHNALTLNQLETFFAKITTHKFDTPFTSPQHPSTPISFYPPLACSHLNNAPIYGSATSLPTTINDQNVSDELLFFSTPPNQCDLPYSLDAQEQDLNQQPQQYTGSLLRIYSADNMATMNTTIPSLKTAAQPSSSTTDGFAEVTSETVTDYGCWLKHTEPE